MYQQSNLTTNTAINYGGSFYIPIAGTLRKCYGTFQTGAASAGSAENSTFNIRVNDTTSVLVSNTVQLTGASSLISFSNASMSTSLSAGDFISFEWITPAWGTPPTSCGLNVTVLIS
jgi:hypothetical protein